MATPIAQLTARSLDELCTEFLTLTPPTNEEEAKHYTRVCAVTAWAFLKQVSGFSLGTVLAEKKAIMEAMMGHQDDPEMDPRISSKLRQSRVLFNVRLRLLTTAVVDQVFPPQNSVQEITSMLQTLSTGPDSQESHLIELTLGELRSFRDAFEALITWTRLTTMTREDVSQLLINLVTNYIPLARGDQLQGFPHGTVRLEMFKDLLAVITGAAEITDAQVDQLYQEAGVAVRRY